MDSTRQTPYSHGGTGEECVGGRATISAVTRDASWQHTARQARLLSWLSLACMSAEGAIAIIAAVIAGSVALLGFGPDSGHRGLGQRDHRVAVHRHPVRDRRGSRCPSTPTTEPAAPAKTVPRHRTGRSDEPARWPIIAVQASGQVADVLHAIERAARARWDTWANPEWIGYAARAFYQASPPLR